MSDNGETKGKLTAWTEHEMLVYLLSAIEHNGVKIDFANTPAPAGRNASGCSQKMNRLKIALRAEIDAIKNGTVFEAAADATPKKAPGRKRKGAATEEDGEGTPKKRGRPKKGAAPELTVKDEPKEMDIEAEV